VGKARKTPHLSGNRNWPRVTDARFFLSSIVGTPG
jgi:hypothetical protein